MLHPFEKKLPSDNIRHRYGFDGNEPDQIRRHNNSNKFGIRSTFAINTFYQEVSGGYYENRALFCLIDTAIRTVGLFPVILDIYRADGLLPVEGPGHLLVYEEYAIINDKQIKCGELRLWRFNTGGGGTYYSDNIIFDINLPIEPTNAIVDEVERLCLASTISFKREPDAVEEMPSLRKRLRRRWF